MAWKSSITIAIFLMSITAQPAAAINCSDPAPSNYIPAATLQAFAANRYTCAGTYPNAEWNELLSGGASGTVVDYKLNTSADPSVAVGIYAITDDGNGSGVITYTYASGGTYSYRVGATPVSGSTFNFCQTAPSPGSLYLVNIQSSHC